jgi:RNA polymerase sigma-70 factor (ECF subfamily)
MLRYFGSYGSYEEIASICGVPVGTVRSRLSQVKVKLADEMLETAQAAHGEAAAIAEARTRHFNDAVIDFSRTGRHDAFLDPVTDDVEIVFPGGTRYRGRAWLEWGLAEDAAAGVDFLPTKVISGPGITILEARFINPSYDPFHCPPAMSQIHFHRGDDTYRMVWHYAKRDGERGSEPR